MPKRIFKGTSKYLIEEFSIMFTFKIPKKKENSGECQMDYLAMSQMIMKINYIN